MLALLSVSYWHVSEGVLRTNRNCATHIYGFNHHGVHAVLHCIALVGLPRVVDQDLMKVAITNVAQDTIEKPSLSRALDG